MKTLVQAKDMLKKLKQSRITSELPDGFNVRSNHNEGWIESLEIIIDLYDRNRIEVANRRILEYKTSLGFRHKNDLDVYGKDITNGWLEGSIDSIDWFFE